MPDNCQKRCCSTGTVRWSIAGPYPQHEPYAQAMGQTPWTMDETLERVLMLREAFPPLFGDRWEEARDIFYTAYRAVHLSALEKTALRN